MSPKILCTGFKPFGPVAVNPTEQLMLALSAERFPQAEVCAIVLDTDYARCEAQFDQALQSFGPDAVICFGVNRRADELRLERIAVNVDDAAIGDTGGQLRQGQRIAPDGPVGYWSSLPLEEMHQALQEAGLPVAFSNHAGAYVCNHVFYYGRHLIETRGWSIPMGFIHVPPLPEELGEKDEGRSGMDPGTLLRAAQICIQVLAKALQP